MEQRIKELEGALAEAVLDARMFEAMVDAASKHFNTDLKKAFGNRS